MDISIDELREISYEYDFPLYKIVKYYHMIKNCPCVLERDEQSLIDCLYLIVQDRTSIYYIIAQYNPKVDGTFEQFKKEKYKSLEYSISDALYRIYDEAAIDNLSEQYKYTKRLEKR